MSKLSFRDKVFEVVATIPRGNTMSYSEVARVAGSPGAARAVGNILKKNYDPDIPCQRVIRSNGQLGNYNRGKDEKRKLLKQDGFL